MAEDEKKQDNTSDPGKGFEALLGRMQGDAMRLAEQLYRENYDHREKRRQLEADLEATKKQLPAEGTAVIPAAEADMLKAYQALGKPDDLGRLQGELATMRKAQIVAQAAQAHGYKQGVLQTLAKDATLEMREIAKDGKKTLAAFVIEGEGKATPLTDYAAAHWADFMPSLTGEQSKPAPGNGGDPKPAGAAGTGKANEDARARYARTIRSW